MDDPGLWWSGRNGHAVSHGQAGTSIDLAGPERTTLLFAELVGQSVPFTISFEAATFTRYTGSPPALQVDTSPVTVQFGGTPSQVLQDRVIPALESGYGLTFQLEQVNGQVTFTPIELPRGPAPFHMTLFNGAPFPGALDLDGVPKPQPFPLHGVPSVLEFLLGSPSNSIEATVTGSVHPR
ncbi:hypothetical protein [Stigmatella aurantiaca]|uniref:Uncharacterized protein n=1 Tax=Stigmatella aurantiaca (strain DW4/3-1) TaxID=378806 RepID=Q08V80_STIAD|nr:hypothetical protein [Stigmatella aurantiaca]ADO68982.1 uncharacterized protein STAUR_1178 [Stigmatella aurantiaca DW4/3-1]EAU64398.1 hypothetical protein STIAU_8709 [Stigmatella aurantiaca DW4/3-1]